MVTPEVAFTGDTSAEVFSSPGFEDALAAKLLIIEATFLDEEVSLHHAKVGCKAFDEPFRISVRQQTVPSLCVCCMLCGKRSMAESA